MNFGVMNFVVTNFVVMNFVVTNFVVKHFFEKGMAHRKFCALILLFYKDPAFLRGLDGNVNMQINYDSCIQRKKNAQRHGHRPLPIDFYHFLPPSFLILNYL